MLGFVRLSLGPVLLWQGAQVRRSILRLPEPEGPREGVQGTGAPLSLLILGDSSAAGVGAATQDAALSGQLASRLAAGYRVRWQVLAKTGWTTQDALENLPTIGDLRLDLVVLALGVNDVTTETGRDRWIGIYQTLVERLRQQHGARQIILSGLPPMGRFPALPRPLRWYMGQQAGAHDRALAALAEGTAGAEHLPLPMDRFTPADGAEDGFHPGPPMYAHWADLIAARVRKASNVPVEPAAR